MLHIRRTDDVSRSVNALFFCEPRILARLYVSYIAPVTLILLASPALWTCRVGLTWAFDEHAMALIGDPRRQPPRFTVQWIPPGHKYLAWQVTAHCDFLQIPPRLVRQSARVTPLGV